MGDTAIHTMSEASLAALVGHRFPGGVYRVAHWENWLLTDCTGRDPLPDDLVHPIVLFHAPILGAGTSIAELFRLGGASGASGSVGLIGYDWEYAHPIREEVDYRVEGGIASAERHTTAAGAVDDDVTFRIGLAHDGEVVARVTNRWRFRRCPVAPAARASSPPRHALGGRVVNQGPLNLGYIANMLMAWAGPTSIRRLTVGFGQPVLDGHHVVARGHVRELLDGTAQCDVWLTRGDERVVTGTAEVVAPPGAAPRSNYPG